MLLDALLDWLFSELFAIQIVHCIYCIYVSAQHPTSECDFYMYISETSVICRVLAFFR